MFFKRAVRETINKIPSFKLFCSTKYIFGQSVIRKNPDSYSEDEKDFMKKIETYIEERSRISFPETNVGLNVRHVEFLLKSFLIDFNPFSPATRLKISLFN